MQLVKGINSSSLCTNPHAQIIFNFNLLIAEWHNVQCLSSPCQIHVPITGVATSTRNLSKLDSLPRRCQHTILNSILAGFMVFISSCKIAKSICCIQNIRVLIPVYHLQYSGRAKKCFSSHEAGLWHGIDWVRSKSFENPS